MRTNYIGKTFQAKTALNTSIMIMVSAAVLSAAIYLFLNENIRGGFSEALQTFKALRFNLPIAIGLSEAAALSILTMGIIVLELVMSHKLAGPLWKMENTALQVAAGDLSSDINLREKDEMKELAVQVNSMILGLREKVYGIREAYAVLDECARRLKDAPEAERGAILSEAHAAAGELLSRLESIKTSN